MAKKLALTMNVGISAEIQVSYGLEVRNYSLGSNRREGEYANPGRRENVENEQILLADFGRY